jgi:DNA-directed RNA polymerase specialized sigma24 family protein
MAAGGRDAHAEFCERHRLSLYAQVYALLVDAALAERVVVEALERAWHAAKDFNPGAGSAFAWLSEIARSVAQRGRRPSQGPTAPPSTEL